MMSVEMKVQAFDKVTLDALESAYHTLEEIVGVKETTSKILFSSDKIKKCMEKVKQALNFISN
jgi:hypothetical protein